MSQQLADIASVQKRLEEGFMKKMDELQAQIQSAGPAKDTVAKVAEEFRTFRELIFSILGLLRSQISECAKQVDSLETRHRKKALVFLGVQETDKEDCTKVVLDILEKKLALKNITDTSIRVCHRLGIASSDRQRPILVRFSDVGVRSTVWKAKTGLKGSSVSIKEFLTKVRQSIFSRARSHFGMRSCWTQDGLIVIKTPDGQRHKITTMDELSPLTVKYPGGAVASSRIEGQIAGDKPKKDTTH